MKISFIIPVYNNSSTIGDLAHQLENVSNKENWNCEIIFVDDSSKDASLKTAIALPQCKIVVHLHENKGQSTAVLAGMMHATGDIWVVMDADLQDDPEFAPVLVNCLIAEKKDICFSGRSGKYEGRSKLLSAKGFKYLLHILSGKRLPPDACMFFAIKASSGKQLLPYSGATPYLLSVIAREKLNCTSVYYQRKANPFGKSNYTFLKRWKVAQKGIANFFFLQKKPLPDDAFYVIKNAS